MFYNFTTLETNDKKMLGANLKCTRGHMVFQNSFKRYRSRNVWGLLLQPMSFPEGDFTGLWLSITSRLLQGRVRPVFPFSNFHPSSQQPAPVTHLPVTLPLVAADSVTYTNTWIAVGTVLNPSVPPFSKLQNGNNIYCFSFYFFLYYYHYFSFMYVTLRNVWQWKPLCIWILHRKGRMRNWEVKPDVKGHLIGQLPRTRTLDCYHLAYWPLLSGSDSELVEESRGMVHNIFTQHGPWQQSVLWQVCVDHCPEAPMARVGGLGLYMKVFCLLVLRLDSPSNRSVGTH